MTQYGNTGLIREVLLIKLIFRSISIDVVKVSGRSKTKSSRTFRNCMNEKILRGIS